MYKNHNTWDHYAYSLIWKAFPILALLCITLVFYILWKKSQLKSTFLPYHAKKHHSTLEMDTFKGILLLSYLASLYNQPRTFLDFSMVAFISRTVIFETNLWLKIAVTKHGIFQNAQSASYLPPNLDCSK